MSSPCVAGLKSTKKVIGYLHDCHVIVALWAYLAKHIFTSAHLIHPEPSCVVPSDIMKASSQEETFSSDPD